MKDVTISVVGLNNHKHFQACFNKWSPQVCLSKSPLPDCKKTCPTDNSPDICCIFGLFCNLIPETLLSKV